MTLEQLIPILNSNHFYPGRVTVLKRKKEVLDSLYIDCPPILAETKLSRVREVLPDEFRADYLPNKQEIHIKKYISG